MGINLARLLLSKGWAVRSLEITAFDYPERTRVDVTLGDIRDTDLVDRALAGVEIVVHCAVALPLADEAEIRSTSVDDTLGVYLALMMAYSMRLKGVAINDALALALSYSLRILVGAMAVNLSVSPWLLVCSTAMFFDLALLKRYAELFTLRRG